MWPFEQLARRLHRGRRVEPSPESVRARKQAAEGLRREIERGPEVARVTESLKNAILRNHLSEAMEYLIIRSPREPGR